MVQAALVLTALAAFAQQGVQVAPLGWACRVDRQLSDSSTLELVQTVDPGGGTYAAVVELRIQSHDGSFQSFRWTPDNLAFGLGELQSASIYLKMKRRLRSGSIVLSNPGQIIRMPIAYENFTAAYQGQAGIMLRGPVLRPFWSGKRWQVSVVDGRGTLQGLTTVDLPEGQSLNEAAAQLLSELKTMTAHPAAQCSELGPDADI